jgi:hypothetical protein
MYEIEEHLAPLPGVGMNSLSNESDSDDDSCVEITSTIDENEKKLIKWTNYLQLNSDDDDSDEDTPSTQSALLVDYSSSDPSSDDENFSQSSQQSSRSASDVHGLWLKNYMQSLVSKKTTTNIKQPNKSDVPQNNFECGSRTRMNY